MAPDSRVTWTPADAWPPFMTENWAVQGLPLQPTWEDPIRPVPNWNMSSTSNVDPDVLLTDAVMTELSPSSNWPWDDCSVTSKVSVSSPVLVQTGCSNDLRTGDAVGMRAVWARTVVTGVGTGGVGGIVDPQAVSARTARTRYPADRRVLLKISYRSARSFTKRLAARVADLRTKFGV